MERVVAVDRQEIRAWIAGKGPELERAARDGRLPTAALDLADEFLARLGGAPEDARRPCASSSRNARPPRPKC